MPKSDFPYDPTLLDEMQKALEYRRHQKYLEGLTPQQAKARKTWVDAIDAEKKLIGIPAANAPKPAAKPVKICVLDPEREILILNGKPIALEANEVEVIKRLVEAKAIQLTELRNKSNCAHPDRVLKNLINKYPILKSYISLPGKKGQGGYKTTIELAKKPNIVGNNLATI